MECSTSPPTHARVTPNNNIKSKRQESSKGQINNTKTRNKHLKKARELIASDPIISGNQSRSRNNENQLAQILRQLSYDDTDSDFDVKQKPRKKQKVDLLKPPVATQATECVFTDIDIEPPSIKPKEVIKVFKMNKKKRNKTSSKSRNRAHPPPGDDRNREYCVGEIIDKSLPGEKAQDASGSGDEASSPQEKEYMSQNTIAFKYNRMHDRVRQLEKEIGFYKKENDILIWFHN